MRRLGFAVALVIAASFAMTASVLAAPATGCPAGASGFTVFEIDAVPGDGVPAAGENAWWDQTLAGIAAEGMTVEEVSEAFGFGGTAEGFFEGIMEALRGLDRNDDNEFCAKPFPEVGQGQLAFFFNAVDNKARAH